MEDTLSREPELKRELDNLICVSCCISLAMIVSRFEPIGQLGKNPQEKETHEYKREGL